MANSSSFSAISPEVNTERHETYFENRDDGMVCAECSCGVSSNYEMSSENALIGLDEAHNAEKSNE